MDVTTKPERGENYEDQEPAVQDYSLTETEGTKFPLDRFVDPSEFTFPETEVETTTITNAFLSGFYDFYKTQRFSDVVLILRDGNRIFAHKLILAYSSRFFSQLLQMKSSMFKLNVKKTSPNLILSANDHTVAKVIHNPHQKTESNETLSTSPRSSDSKESIQIPQPTQPDPTTPTKSQPPEPSSPKHSQNGMVLIFFFCTPGILEESKHKNQSKKRLKKVGSNSGTRPRKKSSGDAKRKEKQAEKKHVIVQNNHFFVCDTCSHLKG